MKCLMIAMLLLPCLVNGQLSTKLTFTLPPGFKTPISVFTSEKDAPVWAGQVGGGEHGITVETVLPATGFMYVAATKQFLPFELNGAAADITKALRLPEEEDGEQLLGAGPEIIPTIDQKFVDITSLIKNASALPIQGNTPDKAQEYYRLVQRLIAFTDSVVALYPKNNVSLFTVYRLGRWCSYNPDVFNLLNKIDTALLQSNFVKELMTKKEKIKKDSIEVAGKKLPVLLQKLATNTKLSGANAQKRLFVYWDDFTMPDKELLDNIKRLGLVFESKALQINLVYTGTSDSWETQIKNTGLPAAVNYMRCAKTDTKGNSPVITDNSNTCLSAGINGYYLYQKIAGDDKR